jgi:hypothetical protein
MTSQFRYHPQRVLRVTASVLLSVVACASIAGAQDPQVPDSNVQEQAPRPRDGTSYLTPEPDRLQRTLTWIGSKLDPSAAPRDGFYPQFGGMIYGAGFSIGPGFRHHVFGDRAVIDVSAAMSWRRYRAMNAQLAWPRLLDDRLSLGAQVTYQDFTRINYFGIGNDSLKSDRTDYRLSDVDALGFATVRANRWLSISGRAGVLRRLDIEQGTSTVYPPVGERFDEITAPSLVRQPNYAHADVAVEADTRDVRGYPNRGGRYRLSMAAYHDQSFSRYSFRRIEADGAQYLPIGPSVVALRGRVALTQDAMQDTAFYLLPALGGANSLRGYSDYRFRDRDLLLLTTEYRWPILRMADVAVFYDAGAVAADARSLTRRMHTDYGLGVRVHSDRYMVVRLDVARGGEGTRANLTFTAPLGLSNRTVAPYVP